MLETTLTAAALTKKLADIHLSISESRIHVTPAEYATIASTIGGILSQLSSRVTSPETKEEKRKTYITGFGKYKLINNPTECATHTVNHTSITTMPETQLDKYVPVTIVDGIDVKAIPYTSGQIEPGILYYISEIDNFAMMVGNTLFCGNIGTIYTDDSNLHYIKDCKYGSSCLKISTCKFFHDGYEIYCGKNGHIPAEHGKAQFTRNFVSSSWAYNNKADNPRGRKIGSRPNLLADLSRITADDIKKYRQQTMHDILCCMIMTKYSAGSSLSNITNRGANT